MTKVFFLWIFFFHQAVSSTGPIARLEELREVDRKNLEALSLTAATNPTQVKDLSALSDYSLAQEYVKSLIFHSDPQWVSLIQENQCHFFSLLKLNLLQTPFFDPQSVLIHYQDKYAIMSKQDYLEKQGAKTCPKLFDLEKSLHDESFILTLSKLPFARPENEEQCQQIHTGWMKNEILPFICEKDLTLKKARALKASETNSANLLRQSDLLQRARQYENLATPSQRSYIQNLCHGLQNKDLFCRNFLTDNYWKRIFNDEIPIQNLAYRCEQILQKKELTKAQLEECIALMDQKPSACAFSQPLKWSYLPRPNCDQLASNYQYRRLQSSYLDCPGVVQNDAVTIGARILNHFNLENFPPHPQYCASYPANRVAEIFIEEENINAWGHKLCFDNRVLKKEECHPIVPFEHPNSPLSEAKVVEKILSKSTATMGKIQCKVIPKRQYNPAILEYKQGCFLTFDPHQCQLEFCPKEIFLNTKKIEHIKYHQKSAIDFIPNDSSNRNFSLNHTIQRHLKSKMREVRNLTEVKAFLRDFKQGLIFGIGCLEDLMPEVLQKRSFNFCRPTTFIIDGQVNEKISDDRLIVSLAIDDVQTPRLINWNRIFNGMKSYQAYHPLNSWTLYGIH